MNNLEESFNRITALNHMVSDLAKVVDDFEQDNIIDKRNLTELTMAIKSFLPVYIRQYEEVSQRAWNNTVGEVRKLDNPLSSVSNVPYEEVVKYFQDEENMLYNNEGID